MNSAKRYADSHLQTRDAPAYDTKQIWEQFLKEIVETRRELSARLDRIEAITLETRSGLRGAKDRRDRSNLDSAKT